MRVVLCNAFEGIKAQSLAESGDQRAQELRWPGSLLPCDHGLLCALRSRCKGSARSEHGRKSGHGNIDTNDRPIADRIHPSKLTGHNVSSSKLQRARC